MLIRSSSMLLTLSFLGLSMVGVTSSLGQPKTATPKEASTEFAIPEAIKGFDEKKVQEDPICDSSRRPKIMKVEPDEVQAGDKVVVMGKNFGGKKECLHAVTFGSEKAKAYIYVDDEKLEAMVPDTVSAGLIFLDVVTGRRDEGHRGI